MKAQLKLVALLATLLPCSVVAQQIQIESATDRFGKQVWIERNTLTGGAERVTGMAINTRDYAVAADELTEQTVALVAAGIASDYAEITGIAAGNLDLRSIEKRNGRWYVSFRQMFSGIPVWGTELSFTIETNGNIHTMGGRTFPRISIPWVTPEVTAALAEKNARTFFETEFPAVTAVGGHHAHLMVYSQVSDSVVLSRLVWIAEVSSGQPVRGMLYFVDASNGDVIHKVNLVKHSDVTVSVKMQYWPQHHDAPRRLERDSRTYT